MDLSHQLALFFLAVLVFAAVSRRVTNRWFTAPMVFVSVGLVLGSGGLGLLVFEPEGEFITLLTEGTLLLLLFSDASQIQLKQLTHHWTVPGRLLGIGMPLTVGLGALVGWLLFPEWTPVEALLVAAVLAPTDAALGQAVVSNPAVPAPIREALTVESGLNDGITLPLVLVLLALAMSQVDDGATWVWFWAQQVVLGPLAGAVVGAVAGTLLEVGSRRRWAESSALPAGSIATALLCYVGAEAIGGNGFMAAFVGGMAFGRFAPTIGHNTHEFLESEGQLLLWMVFTLLGCVFAAPALQSASPAQWVYALLSLTVVRMLPVALSLIGTGFRWPTVAFLGWFGPRGLASLLFGLLLVEGELEGGESFFNVVLLTVLLSVMLHGVTASVSAVRYGAWASRSQK